MDTVVDCHMGSYSTGVIANADCIILLAQLTQACKSPLVIVVNVYMTVMLLNFTYYLMLVQHWLYKNTTVFLKKVF